MLESRRIKVRWEELELRGEDDEIDGYILEYAELCPLDGLGA